MSHSDVQRARLTEVKLHIAEIASKTTFPSMPSFIRWSETGMVNVAFDQWVKPNHIMPV